MHCDNCASDLPRAYIAALVYDQAVALCSSRCLAQLLEVWAPTRHALPWRQCVAALALLAFALWR